MRETPKIVSLAAALAALNVPTAAPPVADMTDSDWDQIATKAEGPIQPDPVASLRGDVDLMSFTVHRTSDGMMFPQHGSHSSHSSHSSHVSHASSSPGYGGPYVPSLPNPVWIPSVDVPPIVVPPAVAPPASTSPTTAPPGYGVDIAYIACTRASSGFGVNDIASELIQVYGVAGADAANIAKQALASVFGGGPYCDSYQGD